MLLMDQCRKTRKKIYVLLWDLGTKSQRSPCDSGRKQKTDVERKKNQIKRQERTINQLI